MVLQAASAKISFFIAVALLFLTAAPINARRAQKRARVRLTPQYSTGEKLRYNIQLRMKTTAHATGPIVDPEGATEFDQSVNVILRLDVISVPRAENGGVRVRATYERVTANRKSNSYDPSAEEQQKRYEKLQGRAIEFTLEPDGRIADVTGLEDVVTDPSRAAEINQWLGQITLGAAVPQKGIAIGEKWSSEQPLAGAPLDGVVWRTASTYQSNEPCPVTGMRAEAGGGTPLSDGTASAREECAIILTRSETRETAENDDRTPAVYKSNGLRTAGIWKGSGETLTAISLRTGVVISVTQSGTTHMDFTVTAAASGNHVRYKGDVQSEVQMTLMRGSAGQ